MEGDYDKAIAYSLKALDQGPRHIAAFGLLGKIYLATGDYTNAIHWLEQEELLYGSDLVQTRQRYQDLQHAFEEGRAPAYWREKWRQTQLNSSGTPYQKAVIQINLGNTTQALEWLEQAYEVELGKSWHETGLNELLIDKAWFKAYDQPHFRQILEKIGFTKMTSSTRP